MSRQPLSRRRALSLGLSTLASMAAVKKGTATVSEKQIQAQEHREQNENRLGLKGRATAKGFLYGAASRSRVLASDPEFANRFAQECSILVTENELKWKALRPGPDHFSFQQTDQMLQFTQTHGLLFRGHTLVWHNSNPQWLIDKFKNSRTTASEIERILSNHISTVVGHYAGQIHSWDVVNEAIKISDGRADGLRDTKISGDKKGRKYSSWLHFLGVDYIDFAFRVAAEADPQAMLFYNDYGLDYDTPNHAARRDAVLKLLYRLKAMGTPIHALGIQAHLRAKETRFSPEKLRDFLRHVGSLDLKIMITEMDVSDQGLSKDINERDRKVAQHYYDYLSVVLDEPAVIGVLTWGLSDRYTWLSNYRPRSDGLPVRPLPLDRDLNRKPAWSAIAKAFDNAPNRAFFKEGIQ